jgi:hypothetical protein
MADEHAFLLSQLAIPVSFCCLELGSDFFEYSTNVVSVFKEGFVITSPRRLRKGSVLSLRMRVPSDHFDNTYFENRCTGRVVGEQKLEDGGVGYKVQLDDLLPN